MAEVFASGVPYLAGHAEGDPRAIPGFTKGARYPIDDDRSDRRE
jgi:hypothetical protein